MSELFSAEVTPAAVAEVTTTGVKKPPPGRSPGQLAWRRFRRDKAGVISACVVLFYFVIGLGAPVISWLYGKDPYTHYGLDRPGLLTDTGIPVKPNGGIDGEFWFGLEPKLGRDVLMQLVYGIRTSLLIALVVVFIVTAFGAIVGIAAGYLGGKADYFIGRVIDVLLAIPSTLFYLAFMPIALALFIAPGKEAPIWLRVISLVLVLSVFGWTRVARLLRGQVLSLREREFIEAARVSGAGSRRIIFKELLPNLITPILIVATLDVPAMVTTEAALSYLGVGMVEPTPDWGRMIHDGGDYIKADITYLTFPGIALIIFVLAFNLLGDSVRDALDPKSHR
ncbi:peptide/nickel transport system permease protein [Amycolatopsis xylanica]|uniref:Peptide/nickel transport system permease protein n=1 Tax=Amycolatopsis xylanica TaxID=589385 RepID=A0A1H3P8A0_9PSEU|nr:ABC transporter permease [Amycolatopsis xylanica]SDY97327.1 peptide/nickel transport system permease protein [Amycolatopsis xylanica]